MSAITASPTAALFRHQFRRTRQAWLSSIAAGLATPTLSLFALGIGVGSQIDDAELANLGVSSYLNYIGPGLLIVTAMQIASNESMWPTMGLLRWQGVYQGVLASPITSTELGTAHVLWIAFRGMVAATCFLIVLALAGALGSWLALLLPPAALLIAWVHSAPLVAITVGLKQENIFAMLNRVVLFPLYLFSGAFFPVDEMPRAVAALARVTPTWHGVELGRHLATGDLTAIDALHVGYLGGLAVLGLIFVRYQFRKHLEL